METVKDSVSENSWSDSQLTECSEYKYDDDDGNDDDQQPKPFDQAELNDCQRFEFAKSFCSFSGIQVKAKLVLCTDTTFAWYKHRERECSRFFAMEHSLVYCVDIQGFIEKLETLYNPSDWRLFIDASKSSLKAVLLRNRNQFASTPLAHWTCMRIL